MVVLHFMELFEPVFARGPDFRNYILLIAYHLPEICLGSIIILVWLHVLGFSSHRITSMIQFCPRVCVRLPWSAHAMNMAETTHFLYSALSAWCDGYPLYITTTHELMYINQRI
jgi:hypothetical protein